MRLSVTNQGQTTVKDCYSYTSESSCLASLHRDLPRSGWHALRSRRFLLCAARCELADRALYSADPTVAKVNGCPVNTTTSTFDCPTNPTNFPIIITGTNFGTNASAVHRPPSHLPLILCTVFGCRSWSWLVRRRTTGGVPTWSSSRRTPGCNATSLSGKNSPASQSTNPLWLGSVRCRFGINLPVNVSVGGNSAVQTNALSYASESAVNLLCV